MTSLDQGRRRDRPTDRELQEEWENRDLMHAVLKHQFGNGAMIRVGAVFERHVLENVAAEVARRIQNIPRGRQFLEHRRARFLIDAVKQIVRTGSSKARDALLAEAKSLAGTEGRWLATNGLDILGSQWRTPAPSLVEAAISKEPMLGRQFGEWFEDWVPRATESRIVARVRSGMLAGESTPTIVRSLQGTKAAGYVNGELAFARRAMAMLTRTTMTHTSAVARDLTFRRNSDIVQKVRFVATLDLRTSVLCASLDGNVYLVDEAYPKPPIHPHCRSDLQPAVGQQIGQRAALGGRVDARTRYVVWIKGRSIAEQNLVLGKAKAEAWRAGRLSIDEMVDASLTRVLPNYELAATGKI